MYNINEFSDEIGSIQSERLASFVTGCLLKAPDYFYTMPTSTSGLHHPAYCLGEGGLVRHVKATVALVNNLLRLEQFQSCTAERDLIVAALLLHDIAKKDPIKNETDFEHPLNGAVFVEDMAKKCDNDMQIKAKEIARLIRSHMGQWNTSSKCPGVILPKPEKTDEKLVHLCDYLASRNNIIVDLDY